MFKFIKECYCLVFVKYAVTRLEEGRKNRGDDKSAVYNKNSGSNRESFSQNTKKATNRKEVCDIKINGK